MIIIVIRASRRNWDVDKFIRAQEVPTNNVWRQGERRVRGTPHDDSGFTIDIENVEVWEDGRRLVEEFFLGDDLILDALSYENADVVLSVGVTVGSDESYAPTLSFPMSFLEKLVRYRVELSISAYPASDE